MREGVAIPVSIPAVPRNDDLNPQLFVGPELAGTTVSEKHENMQIKTDSDAAYLVAPKGQSRIAGFYYFQNEQNMKKSQILNMLYLLSAKA